MGGNRNFTFSVAEAPVAPVVTGRLPASLTKGVATTVTVSGTNFPGAAVFAIDNVVCNSDYSRSQASLSQTCTAQPGTPSSVGLVVKSAAGLVDTISGGNRSFTFTVRP